MNTTINRVETTERLISRPGMDWALLWMRVLVGGLMLFVHGWQKLINFGVMQSSFADPLGIGSTASLGLTVFAEVFCSVALIIGLATRFAAIPLLIEMLVLIFMVHAADPWQVKEFALMYAIPYAAFIMAGAGRYSFDAMLTRPPSSREIETRKVTEVTTYARERETSVAS